MKPFAYKIFFHPQAQQTKVLSDRKPFPPTSLVLQHSSDIAKTDIR
jgi:hypothetical protein